MYRAMSEGASVFLFLLQTPAYRQRTLDTLKTQFKKSALETRYYTPQMHIASFTLPKYIEHTLECTHEN